MVFPTTTAVAALPVAARSSQRSPSNIKPQLSPLKAASTLPRAGSGAVATGLSVPRKIRTTPTARAAMNSRSRPRTRSRSSHGDNSAM